MHVPKIGEMVDLLRPEEESRGQSVDRRVTPPLVVEAAVLIKEAKEVAVGRRPEECHVGNLKVGPEVTHIPHIAVCIPARATQPCHQWPSEGPR